MVARTSRRALNLEELLLIVEYSRQENNMRRAVEKCALYLQYNFTTVNSDVMNKLCNELRFITKCVLNCTQLIFTMQAFYSYLNTVDKS